MRHLRVAVLAALVFVVAVPALEALEPVYLADVATSGAGTEADPYLLDTAGWESVKGRSIVVNGVFQIPHGAMFELTSDTRVNCEAGQFRLPASQRNTDNPMFKIAKDATGVGFYNCEWHPGVVWMTTGPCAHLGSTDTAGGVGYIQIGLAGEAGTPQFEIIGNTFHPPRIFGGNGLQIKNWVGSRNARIEDNRFELSVNNIAFARSSNTAIPIDTNLIIRNNVFDGLELDAQVCIDTDDSIDFEANGTGAFIRESNNTLIEGNMFRELGPPLHWHANGEQLRFTGNTYYGGTTHFLTMTSSWFHGITIDGNNCYGGSLGANPGGCDIEITGVTDRINIFGNHLDTVINNTGLISSMLTLNGTLTDMIVHDNYMNGNRTGWTIFDCISLGTATNVQILDNVCVDITDFVHLKGDGKNIVVQGNILHADDPSVVDYILNIDPGNHSGIRALDNHMTGFPSLEGAWTNNVDAIDYEIDNTWNDDWDADEYVRVTEKFSLQDDDGTKWSFVPGGPDQSLLWNNPGIGHTTTVLTSDNQGGIDYVPALVVDRQATVSTAPTGTTAGGNPWSDATNAFGLDNATFAWSGRSNGIVYEQRYDWSDTTVGDWHLEVTWDTAGGVGCSNECTFTVLVCTSKPCDPDVEVDKVSWSKGQSTGTRRSYHDFGTIDPSTIEVKVRWLNSGAGGPQRQRATARVYGVQLTDAPYKIGMPDAVKKFIDIGADPPAQCDVGDIWIDTDTSTDWNCVTAADYAICVCHAKDSWASAN